MLGNRETAKEALRILRRIEVTFSDGSQKVGSGFCGVTPRTVITCAHVVSEPNTTLKSVTVDREPATILQAHSSIDLAVLSVSDPSVCELADSNDLQVGDEVTFAGYPTGVSGPSVFGGILSARGNGLIRAPRCEVLQINGMINAGNSGGPVLAGGTNKVVGVVTAKFVPLLEQIDRLRDILKATPQFPKEVAIGRIDFSAFVNFVFQALASVSGSLRLVQVGTGYAIPSNVIPR
jgi:S1-C subfamily serine protease